VIEVDALDLRLVHALQVDGRASFTRIAQVLGVSDQTIARRYARLRSSGALRVVGLTDPDVTGDMQWYVRVRATPDAAQPIARALAKRSDTSWVMLLAGGTEIMCTVRTTSGGRGGDLLLSALPKTAKVLAVQAHCRLHQYFGGPDGAVEKLDLLRPDQVTALLDGRPASTPAPEPRELDKTEQGILGELALDGRTGLDRLAVATSVPLTTVRRRLESLRQKGVLFFDVEFDNRMLARSVEAVLWLKVEPAALRAAGTALGAHREVAFAAACTGPFALLAYVMTPDPGSLYAYLTTAVATLPGVREVETAPVIRLLKGPGADVATDT
jgi:DNA-binding Lrp family transcriptional regulator